MKDMHGILINLILLQVSFSLSLVELVMSVSHQFLGELHLIAISKRFVLMFCRLILSLVQSIFSELMSLHDCISFSISWFEVVSLLSIFQSRLVNSIRGGFFCLLDLFVSFSDMNWIVDQSLLVLIFLMIFFHGYNVCSMFAFSNNWMSSSIHGLVALVHSSYIRHFLLVINITSDDLSALCCFKCRSISRNTSDLVHVSDSVLLVFFIADVFLNLLDMCVFRESISWILTTSALDVCISVGSLGLEWLSCLCMSNSNSVCWKLV